MVSRLPGEGPLPSSARTEPERLLYDEVRSRVTPQDYDTWFSGTPCRFQLPNRFTLLAENKFRKAWLEKNFRDLLRACARALFEGDAEIEFTVRDAPPGWGRSGPPPPPVRRDASPAAAPARPVKEPAAILARHLKKRDLNQEFTFDNFVVGASNRFAHAGAIAVSDGPGATYNPLFLCGEPGVGKTHLLHALCHRLLENTSLRVTFLTSEEFLNDFIAAVTSSRIEEFRSRCRDTDVLVVDGVQFLAKKEKTQEELFHTFNALADSRRQIVLASTLYPKESSGLEERLASRFRGGFLARLEAPEFETRIAILGRKARVRGMDLASDVAELLARHAGENPRELEGVLTRLMTVASLRNAPLDMETARLTIREVLDEARSRGTITIAQILRTVQDYYELKPKDLLSRSKLRSLVLPRQVGMYLARKLTPLSLEEIGMHFGGKDHTTVIYAITRIEKLRQSTVQVQTDLAALKQQILTYHSI
jgi:chromosomal replication initiator protein